MMKRVLLILALVLVSAVAFVPSSNTPKAASLVQKQTQQQQQLRSSTQLFDRRWNFNEGRSPWGIKDNAEIWNGRVAQVAFVIVFLQEVIQGKGVIQGLAEGDPVNIVIAGGFGVSLVALTAWLAYKGDDDLIKTRKKWME
mmetsp:Transcript_32859/g.46686  ORF Transcript_32859/g.46686 Transcript_32859/m.46686 type:complete len:141 (+) Transcript_32859:110-532(+)|eukprot:CAMPEP_0202441336 /NCGR_PEP_ID=MMETSP1360-20130828/822_1 /ASSEMBLY_ACC=CAM_ASM_000848 /TAXON_ID=515479 /ORGANISM="Licmophora paradoxa, Strain CCMP2313" /LENGTH=140 /DNA_ID=CAMNT_0049056271 /DNA_START=114 /DNA_END=536 /DNA_ORIENTATION=+